MNANINFNIKNLLVIAGVCATIYILYSARQVVISAVFGMLIAFMLNPIVEKMSQIKIPRIIGAILVVIFIILALFVAIIWLVPQLYLDVEHLARSIPKYVVLIMGIVSDLGEALNLDLSTTALYNYGMSKLSESGTQILRWLGSAVGSVQHAVAVVVYIVFVPVIAFFMLADYPKFNKFLDNYMSGNENRGLRKYFNMFYSIMASYYRGQFTVMGILCVLYSVALYIVGLDMAILLGVMTGLFSIVPYLGFAVGIILSIIAALVQFQDLWHPIYVILGYTIVQLIESFVITPKIVGGSVGLHPLATIIVLLISGTVFGLLGMIFALPIASMAFRIYKEYWEKKKEASAAKPPAEIPPG